MPLSTIDAAKDIEVTYRALLLAVFTFTDGSVYRASTAPLKVSEGGFQYGGNDYEGRIITKDLGAIQGFSEGGIDIVPRVSITLADADKSLLVNYEQAKGFKGATLQLDFIFWEANTSTFSSDSIRKFEGICDAAQTDEATITITATNKLNLQRRMLPSVPLQRRCPWAFPTTAAQRQDGADNEDSIFFRCGYSPDATGGNARGNYVSGSTPFTSCDFTKAACIARGMYIQDSLARVTGRFGGVQWDPPAGSRSREYTTGDWLDLRNNPNEAKYGSPIPMVYGTAWVDAVVVPVLGDGNSTRGEAIVCLGEVESIYRVVVNDVELQPATSIDGSNYIVRDPLLRYNVVNRGDRNGRPNADSPYDSNGDPYGSFCTILWVVPRRVAESASTPRVRVLVRGPKLRVYTDPSTFSRTYTENPAWVIMDLLVQAGLQYADLSRQSFIDFASIASTSINYTDQYGGTSSHARFACSLVLKQRRSAAELIRLVRQGSGAILVPNSSSGLLEIFHKGTLASQQPSAVSGSNNNTPVSSKSLAGVTTDGYLAFDFTKVLRVPPGPNSKSTLRILTPPNNSQPNRVSFGFINSERDYSADSLSVVDASSVARIEQEVDQQLDVEAINSLDQGKRMAARFLAESLGDGKGNPIYQFEYGPGVVRLRAGHICRLSDTHHAISNQLIRILQIRPSTDFKTCQIVAAKHDDNWYVDTYGQAADPGASNQARNRLARPSYPWAPKKEQPPTGDPIFARTDWTFGMSESHEDAADGTSIAKLIITGRWPVNIFSPLAPPIVGRQGTTAASGGTIAGGGIPYYYAVCAVDGDGLLTIPSILCEIVVTAGTDLNTATVPISQWQTGAVGYKVFGGKSPNKLTFQAEHAASTPSSITLTAYEENNYGIPDPEFDKIRVKVKRVAHSGLFGIALTGVGTGTLTVSGAGFTVDEWANYDCSILARGPSGGALGVFNFTVSSNTSTVLTVTPDPNALGIVAGDVLVMRSRPTVGSDGDGNYLLDARWQNSIEAGGAGLSTDAEKGKLLRIFAGKGRGETYRIKKNNATKVWIEGDWLTTPDTTTRYVIEEPDWKVVQTTDTLDNPDPAGELSIAVEVENYERSTILVQVVTLDGGDNESIASLSPVRDIYVFGDGGEAGGATHEDYAVVAGADNITPVLDNGLNQQITLDRATTNIALPTMGGAAPVAGTRFYLKFLHSGAARNVAWAAGYAGNSEYPALSGVDGYYDEFEFRMRPDGKAELKSFTLKVLNA